MARHWAYADCQRSRFAPTVTSGATFGVGVRRRDGEFHLRTCIRLAPYVELASYEICSLAHATQAVVPLSPPISQDLGRYTLTVVANAQAKLPPVVPKLHRHLRTP